MIDQWNNIENISSKHLWRASFLKNLQSVSDQYLNKNTTKKLSEKLILKVYKIKVPNFYY